MSSNKIFLYHLCSLCFYGSHFLIWLWTLKISFTNKIRRLNNNSRICVGGQRYDFMLRSFVYFWRFSVANLISIRPKNYEKLSFAQIFDRNNSYISFILNRTMSLDVLKSNNMDFITNLWSFRSVFLKYCRIFRKRRSCFVFHFSPSAI